MLRLASFGTLAVALLVAVLAACGGGTEPRRAVELTLVAVDGRAPPVTIFEGELLGQPSRIDILAGSLSGLPRPGHVGTCYFKLARRTTEGSATIADDVTGDTPCGCTGERAATARIDLLWGGPHFYSFARE